MANRVLTKGVSALAMAAVAAAVGASTALAQPTADMRVTPTTSGGGGIGAVRVSDPGRPDPMAEAYAQHQKRRVGIERELKKLRFAYFRSARNTELRQAGIARLREYNDPAAFTGLLEIFRDEGPDVRNAILDQLADCASDEGDATLAWTAAFDHEKAIRDGALERLRERVAATGTVSRRVQSVVSEGLRRSNETQIASAAIMADVLNLYEAIPMLISAQLGGTGTAARDEDTGALAYILVGQQQAFVEDLTPVVGDSAVAFDPTLGVVTEGVFLRVIDAYVVTYRSDVHNALTRLSSRGWGRDTGPLGWDQREWRRWYAEEFLPHRAAVAAAELQSSRAAEQQSSK
jgi:hypothetical protein